MIKEILKHGDPALYEVIEEIKTEEKMLVLSLALDLNDTLMEYRRLHGAGRGRKNVFYDGNEARFLKQKIGDTERYLPNFYSFFAERSRQTVFFFMVITSPFLTVFSSSQSRAASST